MYTAANSAANLAVFGIRSRSATRVSNAPDPNRNSVCDITPWTACDICVNRITEPGTPANLRKMAAYKRFTDTNRRIASSASLLLIRPGLSVRDEQCSSHSLFSLCRNLLLYSGLHSTESWVSRLHKRRSTNEVKKSSHSNGAALRGYLKNQLQFHGGAKGKAGNAVHESRRILIFYYVTPANSRTAMQE